MVVDANPTSRSLSCMQLRDMGLSEITQCARPAQVRVALERHRYDIVLCSLDNDEGVGWQDLFDELRREALLPHSTVLFIITAEATYSKVREAAEAALDGYLLRPYHAGALDERLTQAWQRKQELAPLLDAMREQRDEQAVRWCLERVRQGGRHATFAARVACELLLKLQRPDEVVELCNSIGSKPENDWARLNIVRALQLRNEPQRARRLCEEVVQSSAHYADAHDLHTQLLVEHGDLPAALESARRAVLLTPGCVLRSQACGALAFYAADVAGASGAVQMLQRAVSLGLHSRLFDALSLALLGLAQFDLGDGKGLGATRSSLTLLRQRHPESVRLERFDQVLTALRHLQLHEIVPALAIAQQLGSQAAADDFDIEAAVVTLALWARVPPRELEAGALERMVRAIGCRHASTRAAYEVMLAAVRAQEQLVALVQSCHEQTSRVAEEALAAAMSGRAREALQSLLEHGERWRNVKLLELTIAVARRRADTLGADSEACSRRAAGLLAPLSQPGSYIAGMLRTRRDVGGLIVRR